MKVLFVATVRSHIGHFHMPFIRKLKELGHSVDAAYKDNSVQKPGLDLSGIDNVFEVPFSRSPYSLDNIKAYRVLKKILEENDYDAVHCHTPMGAVVTRLAAKSLRKKGLKVIYTAHGFHFYNGASKFNWLVFYNIEKYLSRFTDCLITINKEDFELAKSKGFKAKNIVKVHGVGVDLSSFKPVSNDEKRALRKSYGYGEDDFILIYPANLTAEKNHEMLFKTLKILNNERIKLLCPGQTELLEQYEERVNELGISNQVDFLGFRRDIEKLDALADVSVSASVREGLPVNLIEAMACGNAIVATNVRGNNDLVADGENGYIIELNDCECMADRIKAIMNNDQLLNKFKLENTHRVSAYSTENVIEELLNVYKSLNLI
ncbi:MAG: glycosyltransferase family 4 protein [Eubacterium sp.]